MKVKGELRRGRKRSKGGEGTSEGHSGSRKRPVFPLISRNLGLPLCENVTRQGRTSPAKGTEVTDRAMGGASKSEVQRDICMKMPRRALLFYNLTFKMN